MYKLLCKQPGKERQQKVQFSAEVSQHCCTSVFESWNQGCFPYVKISQRITPKLQTSLSVVNFLYMMLSGGIQRIGSMVCPPTWVRIKAQGHLSGESPEEWGHRIRPLNQTPGPMQDTPKITQHA